MPLQQQILIRCKSTFMHVTSLRPKQSTVSVPVPRFRGTQRSHEALPEKCPSGVVLAIRHRPSSKALWYKADSCPQTLHILEVRSSLRGIMDMLRVVQRQRPHHTRKIIELLA